MQHRVREQGPVLARVVRGGIDNHLDAVDRGIGRRRERGIDSGQQIPLIFDRKPRAKHPRTVRDMGVHPGAAGNIVAHSLACAGCPGQPGASRPTMEVDAEVELRLVQRDTQPQVIADPLPSTRVRYHDDVVQMRVVCDDGRGRRLDQIADFRRGEVAPLSDPQFRAVSRVSEGRDDPLRARCGGPRDRLGQG